jgi:hypothetical protein
VVEWGSSNGILICVRTPHWFFASIACVLFASILDLSADAESDDSPIPFLSFWDIQSLYPPKHHIGDWNLPKVADVPHRSELVERCRRDLRLSLQASPDPFQMHRPLPAGKLDLSCVTRDPESGMLYFVFDYDSPMVVDFHVIYYYDPHADKFVLKSRL